MEGAILPAHSEAGGDLDGCHPHRAGLFAQRQDRLAGGRSLDYLGLALLLCHFKEMNKDAAFECGFKSSEKSAQDISVLCSRGEFRN